MRTEFLSQFEMNAEMDISKDQWRSTGGESCNFRNLLVFGFPETSQNLMSFRQLSGPKGKI